MQIEIIGYEEKRTIKAIWNTRRSRIRHLIPSKRIQHFLQLRFPDWSVETVRTSRAVIDKYIAASH